MDISSQNKAILETLKTDPKGLTGMDMIRRFGAMSYTRRIRDLRESGNPIGDVWEHKLTEEGKIEKKWKRYFYIG